MTDRADAEKGVKLVDGINIGSVIPRSGFIRVTLTSDGSSDQLLPPSIRPVINIRHIEVRDVSGKVVLQGNFAASQTQIK